MTEKVPGDRHYTKSHEWVKEEGGELLVGITDHAQAELTDIVFVELPQVGKAGSAGASLLVLESVKTVADIYAPSDGTVTAVNADLKAHPEWINQDPYGKGWIFRFKASKAPEGLLDAAAYSSFSAASSGH